jgi:acetyltransferase-like isoleucine patch superfamily enzyme
MGKYKNKIKTDFGGYFFSKCRWINYRINQSYYSFITRILLVLKKIKIGKSTVFYGKPYFCRHPESSINIGDNCIFDSSKFRNLIGVDKCCTLSTLTKYAELSIGNSSGFSGVRISCSEKISIGDNCLIGANVLITDTDWHPIDPTRRQESLLSTEFSKPVTIGNNVFVGVNVIILKGSEIGDNSVIGAGSIVSGIIPPNVIAAGNPCKVIKTI